MRKRGFLQSFLFLGIVINEFSSSGSSDWIELLNTSESEINMVNYEIRDTASTAVEEFESDLYVPGNGYCVIDVENRLNNKGDVISLYNSDSLVDCVTYGDGNGEDCGKDIEIDEIVEGQFGVRMPNGEGGWAINNYSTRGYSNNETVEPANKISCFTPTPTPTATPKPTVTPTPTAPQATQVGGQAPTPTPTAVVMAKTVTPRATATPSKEAEEESEQEVKNKEVLGEKAEEGGTKSPIMAYLMIAGGTGLVGAAGFPFAKEYYRLYNKRKKNI